MSDYRDLVITDLADQVAHLEQEVTRLAADCDSYRVLAQEALHRTHELTQKLEQASRTVARAIGLQDPHPPRQDNPWYPSVDDPTDVSKMVKADDIRWK